MILRYQEADASAAIVDDLGVTLSTWNRVSELVGAVEPDAVITSSEIRLSWASVLAILPQLATLSREGAWKLTYEGGADEQLKNHSKRRAELRDALSAGSSFASTQLIVAALADKGFVRQDGPLMDFQVEHIARLRQMAHGANFSVPGAGKTTVAMAIHALLGVRDVPLLVVAPKNAFAAWDEAVDECIIEQERPWWRFKRLTGGYDAVANGLRGPNKAFIISYDQLIRVETLVLRFLAMNHVHMILDESHRIKGGSATARGAAIRRLEHLPIRRDILTGTPIPHSIRDIVPQISFLWPGERLGEKAANATEPNAVLRPLYVRATKNQLGLPKPLRDFVQIPMAPAQMALYGMLRSELVRRFSNLSAGSAADLQIARRSVMRLLQVSSNPTLAVRGLSGDGLLGMVEGSSINRVFSAIVDEGDSPKILAAVKYARKVAVSGRKIVVWTMFTKTVERTAALLADVGAVFIHGGVETGAVEDEDTREHLLEKFKHDASCLVLVANPAACSEGISLHHACHEALYVDRSFNAGHYLQSVDRIHRLGLDPRVETRITVLESIAPGITGSIDYSVRRRLIVKLREMSRALSDQDLELLALDEDDVDLPLDFDISVDDILDVIEELSGAAPEPTTDEFL